MSGMAFFRYMRGYDPMDEEDEACPECGRMPAEGCASWCPENVDADEDDEDFDDEDLEDEP